VPIPPPLWRPDACLVDPGVPQFAKDVNTGVYADATSFLPNVTGVDPHLARRIKSIDSTQSFYISGMHSSLFTIHRSFFLGHLWSCI
jgi:hypothetical protein